MRLTMIFVVLLLTACATTPPIETAGTDKNLTPDRALANIDAARGQRAAWGGMIVNTKNLKDATEIEVLGLPLAKDTRPDRDGNPQHRFLLIRAGYLEPSDYRNGRLVSAVGTVEGMRNGQVGEAAYTYPVLRAEQIYLWPSGEDTGRNSNINFGIGVGVIFGR
ncbi:MAG: Slp family lipoprotein [Sulfurifustis sp.]